ncbi:hypothetical protein H2200_003259 [Cladophialophora chaetospira]|uniref:Uncharacterized protein n=1 Tax=Cladophialophora chaetospira TaxID=386627 RepID=A0AA38XH56_9EURO|nr:hypothetical protein H2200_003259 [Cladophialophora chaetospira]
MASSRADSAEMSPHTVSGAQQADADESGHKPQVKRAEVTSDTLTMRNPNRPGLEIMFNNPIIISSFVKNFTRKDYMTLAQLAATIPGVTMPWPIWEPMTEPWPRGVLPFDIRDLPVRCHKSSRLKSRSLLPEPLQPHPELYTECQWFYRDDDPIMQKCVLSEKDQGLRLRPGSDPSQEMEKKPLEFLECLGYKITLLDCGVFSESRAQVILTRINSDGLQKPASAYSTTSTIDGADNGFHHGPGRVVCSDCSYNTYVGRSRCIWSHDRMIPLCRDCSTNPRKEVYDVSLGLDVSNLFHNILMFAEGRGCHECDCHERLAPTNGFHFCAECQILFRLVLQHQSDLTRDALYGPTGTDPRCYEIDWNAVPRDGHSRNFCPCGKSWTELVQSWNGFSLQDRDEKLYRLCLMCLGHIPRKKVYTARPTNCL